MALNKRQRLFVLAHSAGRPAVEAVVVAGYSARTAERQAERLLSDKEVVAELEAATQMRTAINQAERNAKAQHDRRRAHLRIAATVEPAEHQERYQPTEREDVTIWRVAEGRPICERARVSRRASEALFRGLTIHQRGAAERLQAAWDAAMGPIRQRIVQMENAGRRGVFARAEAEKRLRVAERFWRWVEDTLACRVTVSIICHGLTCREAERCYRLRNGTASDMVAAELDRWASTFGG